MEKKEVVAPREAEVHMVEPEVVRRVRVLRESGWGAKRIANELGLARNTVRRYLRLGDVAELQVRPAARRLTAEAVTRAVALWNGPAEGNAIVVQQMLATEGIEASARTVQRAVEGRRREVIAAVVATVRFDTAPGRQMQVDFGEKKVRIAGQLVRLSVRQLEIVTYSQCAALGLSASFVKRRLATRQWLRLHRGVFKVSGSAPTVEQQEAAALLAAGHGAVLSHQSAAKHHRLDVPSTPIIHLTIPGKRNISALSGTRVWRSIDFPPFVWAQRWPLRITPLDRTVLDLASILDDSWLRAVVDSALRPAPDRLVTFQRLVGSRGRGRAGAQRLRKLLSQYEQQAEIPDSALESLGVELTVLLSQRPVLHYWVMTQGTLLAEVDLGWPELQIGVEFDGWKHHGNRFAFGRDRWRDRQLTLRGWTVMRFTWKDVSENRDRVLVEISQAVARRLHRSEAIAPRTDSRPASLLSHRP